MITDMQEFHEYMKVRKDLYIFLAKTFYKEATVNTLVEMGKRLPIFKAAGDITGDKLMEKGCEIMASFLEDTAVCRAETVSALECVFAKNFLGVSGALGEPSVALCESVYLSTRKIMMQEERDRVVEFYREYKIAISDDFHEPEDHISGEMSFLSALSGMVYDHLTEGEEDKAEEKLKAQLSFLETHLGKWISPLCKDLRKRPGSPYYEAISYIVEGFVTSDTVFLKSILGDDEA